MHRPGPIKMGWTGFNLHRPHRGGLVMCSLSYAFHGRTSRIQGRELIFGAKVKLRGTYEVVCAGYNRYCSAGDIQVDNTTCSKMVWWT